MPVLLVDDVAEVTDAYRVLLESAGYTVRTAENGLRALEMLRRGLQPSIILLDLMMPEMDGFQFRVAQLRDPALVTIPVVVFSGHPFDARTVARLGAVRYMQKPLDPEVLLATIAAHRLPPTLVPA